MIGGRYKATTVNATSAPQVAAASRLTGLFQTRVSEIARPTGEFRPIRVQAKAPQEPSPQEMEIPASAMAPSAPANAEGVEGKEGI